ncbi:unnamed protein product [Prorocentrum cordatum]|uniref:Thioredoxin domain-containing protein n=1 Tax=Prorocentrum cordatum TaxID=2364126 RepID=A0ABN9W3L8_9DINO|nr:unnamed protein product [Polarella glacialis]
MKPAWDKLMKDFEGSTTSLVADVDCTESGKDLCETHGVQGFPTIKYGDPGDLKDYEGGRDYDELKKFASENLGPTCGPDYMELCDAKSKEKINKYMAMSAADLEAKIKKAIEVVEVDIPIMNKAISYAKR